MDAASEMCDHVVTISCYFLSQFFYFSQINMLQIFFSIVFLILWNDHVTSCYLLMNGNVYLAIFALNCHQLTMLNRRNLLSIFQSFMLLSQCNHEVFYILQSCLSRALFKALQCKCLIHLYFIFWLNLYISRVVYSTYRPTPVCSERSIVITSSTFFTNCTCSSIVLIHYTVLYWSEFV